VIASHSTAGSQSSLKRNPVRETHDNFNIGKIRPTKSGLISHRASEIAPKNVEWLWPERIALGKVTLIAGDPGLGKSQISADIAARTSTGDHWPNNEGRAPQGSVIILNAEDDEADTIVPRLMAARADRMNIYAVSAVRDQKGNGNQIFNLQTDVSELEVLIEELGDVRLIIIDPISSYLGTKLDSHVNTQVRGALAPLIEMAARRGIAIVAITHSPKGQGLKAIHSFVGSIAFAGAARSGFIVAKDRNDDATRLFLNAKQNVAPDDKEGLTFRIEGCTVTGESGEQIQSSRVAWTGYTDTKADDAVGAFEYEQRKVDKAEAFLKDALKSGPVPVKELEALATSEGIAPRTLRRAKDNLNVHPKKDGLKGGWTWGLPS
jgi:putative DNA primase/helicase